MTAFPVRLPQGTCRRKLAASLILALFGLQTAFGIEGVYTNGIGARSMALGGAAVAFPEGPLSALGVNPAGLSLLKDPVSDFGVTASVPTGSFRNRLGDTGKLKHYFGIAPDFAVGLPIGSGPLSFGVGLIPEAGVVAHWRYVDPPGGLGGRTSYGLQENNAKLTLLRGAAGMSVALSRCFSIGGSVGAVLNENALKTPYVFQTQPALKGQKTQIDLHTQGWGWMGSLGMLFRPRDEFQMGLSYQTPMEIDSRGSLTGNASAQLRSLGGPFARARP
ncbi:MAG: outer membrane protein transport protein, partial [Verrucomicrobia bacterium]|nr:outer membrane protein transport protein [Verrucomicrobiota bacterium]